MSHPCSASCWSAPAADDRRPGRVRAPPLRRPPARRARGRRRRSRSRASPRGRSSTRACSRPRSSHRFYADLRDPELQSALAVVHSRFSTNTFPSWELAHPLRLLRPQRRDQHARRQRQLDAGARGGAALGLVRLRSRALPAADPGGQLRLGRLRPLARAAGARRPAARPGDDDDDPGRPRRPRRACRPSSTASTATAPRCSSPGTGRRRWSSPTAACSAPASIATACARGAGWSPTTDSSCSAPRPGVLPVDGRRSSAAAACTRLGCSSSISSAGC